MDPILGQIMLWPVPWVPSGWALCDGSLLNVNQYQALYSILGNAYGGSPGVTFGLPDLRNRVPLGTQTMTAVAQVVGAATASTTAIGNGSFTLTTQNLPSHTHAATFTPGGASSNVAIAIPVVSSSTATTDVPGNSVVLAKTTGPAADIYSTGTPDTTLAPFSVPVPAGGGAVTNASTGQGQAVNISVNVPLTVSTLQPSLTLNYIIALEGVYPSRP